MRKCGFCGERLDPSRNRTRPREYCSIACRDQARRQRDREVLALGRAVRAALQERSLING